MKSKYSCLAGLLCLLLVGCVPTAQPSSTVPQSSTQQPAQSVPLKGLESDTDAFGAINAAEFVENRVKITFDMDAAMQGLGVDNYFPTIELLYDGPSGTVTIWLVHIRNKERVLYTAL